MISDLFCGKQILLRKKPGALPGYNFINFLLFVHNFATGIRYTKKEDVRREVFSRQKGYPFFGARQKKITRRMMMKKKIVLFTLVAFTLAALFAGVAMAQTSPAADQSKVPAFFQAFLEKLAANLGVEQSKLVDAVKQTELQIVDEAVQQGKLTSDQAQKIKDRIEEGNFFPMGHFPGPKNGPKAGFRGKHLDELAQALGISADELKAELQQGKKVADIAQEKGLTADQLRQKLLEARIQAIQQAVKDGKISQEKADEMIKKLQNAPQHGGFGRFGRPPVEKTE